MNVGPFTALTLLELLRLGLHDILGLLALLSVLESRRRGSTARGRGAGSTRTLCVESGSSKGCDGVDREGSSCCGSEERHDCLSVFVTALVYAYLSRGVRWSSKM